MDVQILQAQVGHTLLFGVTVFSIVVSVKQILKNASTCQTHLALLVAEVEIQSG